MLQKLADVKQLTQKQVQDLLTKADDIAYFVYPELAAKLMGQTAFDALAKASGWERGKKSAANGTKTKLPIQHEGYDVYVFFGRTKTKQTKFLRLRLKQH